MPEWSSFSPGPLFFPDKSQPTCRSTSNWGSVNQKETSSGNWGSISWPVTLRDGVPSLESCRAGPCPELRIASPCAAGAARCRAGLGTGRRGAGSWLWFPPCPAAPGAVPGSNTVRWEVGGRGRSVGGPGLPSAPQMSARKEKMQLLVEQFSPAGPGGDSAACSVPLGHAGERRHAGHCAHAAFLPCEMSLLASGTMPRPAQGNH